MGSFDTSTLQVVPCGIDLKSLMNTSSIDELPILLVLTSRPDELTEEELTIASITLASYLNTTEETVILQNQTLYMNKKEKLEFC